MSVFQSLVMKTETKTDAALMLEGAYLQDPFHVGLYSNYFGVSIKGEV